VFNDKRITLYMQLTRNSDILNIFGPQFYSVPSPVNHRDGPVGIFSLKPLFDAAMDTGIHGYMPFRLFSVNMFTALDLIFVAVMCCYLLGVVTAPRFHQLRQKINFNDIWFDKCNIQLV